MILTNLLFVIACTFLLSLQKLLYGSLRPIEIEQLYEKAWFAVTETCLAMTVFRGEVGLSFLAMFFALLTGKVWGWIGEGRVEVLEQQPPRNPRLFHTRLALSLGLSVAFDLTMLEYVVKQVMRMARPDMMVMFGFEFAVLSIMSISTAIRYAIDLVEIGMVREQKRLRIEDIKRERVQAAVSDFQEAQNAQAAVAATSEDGQTTTVPTPTQRTLEQVTEEALNLPVDENEVEVEGWEEKGRYMFYLNLATDFFKLVIYLAFFFILLVFYGLPIHILRDVFLTMRSFLKRISDFIKYRTATRDMNARYPDATVEDIGREDVCIICREEMRPYQPPVIEPGQTRPRANPVAERMRPKKLPCGHVLHFSCLRSWLERQQICPTCRANVVQSGRARGDAGGAGQQQGGAQGEDGQPRPGGRQGPRVYQFGPLRIGVGAVRGNNMFEELQQQLEEVRQAAAPGPGPALANGNVNAPRQFGVGIRWNGARRPATGEHDLTTQQQLDALRGQLDREMEELAHNSAELSVLRSMQAEMQRLRNIRPGEAPTHANPEGQNPAPAPGQTRVPPHVLRTAQPLAAGGPHEIIHAGSDRLPPGLTLPEGWSIMPLRPITIDAARTTLPSSVRGFASGIDMMHRQPTHQSAWFPQPVQFQYQMGVNGAGNGQTATFHIQPHGVQQQPHGVQQQPQPFSPPAPSLVPESQNLSDDPNQPTPDGQSAVSSNANGASMPTAPAGLNPGVPNATIRTQADQYPATLFSFAPATDPRLSATEHQPPATSTIAHQESPGPVLPNWRSDPSDHGENSTAQTVNGGSGAVSTQNDGANAYSPENGDNDRVTLENGARNTAGAQHGGAPLSSNNGAHLGQSAEYPPDGQTAPKEKHATVEDLVEDPD